MVFCSSGWAKGFQEGCFELKYQSSLLQKQQGHGDLSKIRNKKKRLGFSIMSILWMGWKTAIKQVSDKQWHKTNLVEHVFRVWMLQHHRMLSHQWDLCSAKSTYFNITTVKIIKNSKVDNWYSHTRTHKKWNTNMQLEKKMIPSPIKLFPPGAAGCG